MNISEISIAIIEDDDTVRGSLDLYFKSQPEFDEVIAAGSVEEFMGLMGPSQKVDVILTDIGLPGLSGIDGIKMIKNRMPRTDILMLTVFKDSDRIFKSLCAGAAGYIIKGAPFEEIKQSVMIVLNGGSYMSPTIARKVVEYFNPVEKTPGEGLTAREGQIVKGLVDGLSYKLIADRLSISVDTVRYHIKHIYAKLRVNSKAEVISRSLKGET